MGGFFRMYKEIFQHQVFKNELDFRLYTLIIGNAVYQDEGVEVGGVHLKKGQWLRSYRKLAKDLEYKVGRGYKQYDIATIKRSISRLEKAGFIKVSATVSATDSATVSATLFEVVEFQKYQGVIDHEENDSATVSATDSATKDATRLRSNKELNKSTSCRKRKKRIYDEDSTYIKMARYLKEKILEWKPNARIPKDLNSWADDFRKIHEIDKRNKTEIKEVIDFATQDDFWQANILSPSKLREKFDTLQAKMQKKRKFEVIPGGQMQMTSEQRAIEQRMQNEMEYLNSLLEG